MVNMGQDTDLYRSSVSMKLEEVSSGGTHISDIICTILQACQLLLRNDWHFDVNAKGKKSRAQW